MGKEERKTEVKRKTTLKIRKVNLWGKSIKSVRNHMEERKKIRRKGRKYIKMEGKG